MQALAPEICRMLCACVNPVLFPDYVNHTSINGPSAAVSHPFSMVEITNTMS